MIQPVFCVRTNHKHWNMSSVPLGQFSVMEDTFGDTTVYWISWQNYMELDEA